jgi:hypothetical protein
VKQAKLVAVARIEITSGPFGSSRTAARIDSASLSVVVTSPLRQANSMLALRTIA